MIHARVHFPTYPNNRQPLRTQFKADSRRPSIVSVYKRVNGRMRLVEAILPGKAVR